MQTTTCSKCANSAVPLNSTLQIDGLAYCENCIKTDFNTDASLEGKQVVKVHDPTVCSNCGKDNGLLELPKISVYPLCEECNIAIRNKTFPTWVKAFLAFLIALILFSFYWNARFFQSKVNFDASVDAFHNKDFKKASELMQLASEQVPEVWDLHLMANFYSGVSLLEEDKSTEALAALETCEGKLPPNFPVDMLILQAKLGASFDQKDYREFLSTAQDLLRIDSSQVMYWGSVASAYACLYAESGQDSFQQHANHALDMARKLNNSSPDVLNYYNMIEYRLFSREIIEKEVFDQKFPNGWTKN